MEGNVDAVIAEAFASGTAKDYALSTEGLEEAVTAQVDELASQWDVQPKNGSISSYDASTDQFVFSDEENGSLIDRDSLKNDILAAMAAADYTAEITASATVVEPEITRDEARENFQRIGTFTTTTTANKDRNENIRLAAAAINGVIVQPGEEFSFNQTTGNRTTEKGYRPAGAYQNGVLVEEPGGGVCQVSSTLYNAVVFSGLKTTERHAHSYEPSYVTPGEDAMVSYDGYSGPDMKFINNSQTAVGLKTSFSNQKLTISVYGNPILEEGVTLSMRSEKTAELDPPAPVYEEDPTLEPGVEKVVKQPVMGSRWVTYLVTKENGTVVNEVLLHNSTYNGKAATIRRNTSGSVLSTEAETSSGESLESSGAAGESESVMDSSAAETTAPQGPASPADQTTGSQNIGLALRRSLRPSPRVPEVRAGPAATESTTAGTVVTMPRTQPSSQLGPGKYRRAAACGNPAGADGWTVGGGPDPAYRVLRNRILGGSILENQKGAARPSRETGPGLAAPFCMKETGRDDKNAKLEMFPKTFSERRFLKGSFPREMIFHDKNINSHNAEKTRPDFTLFMI